MKKLLPLLLLLITILPQWGFSQQTLFGSITHDNLERNYIMYMPASYTGNDAVPLVLNFHGYGSDALQQLYYANFAPFADSSNFLVVLPQGTEDSGGSQYFNVGFPQHTGSSIDDVAFTAALIDSLSAEYNINPDRIYSTGMSNGGYMSLRLACELSDRIAAVASVTGSMTPTITNNCNPQRPVPVMQIHGTDDSVVPYDGDVWSASMDEVVQYWVGHNNCNLTPSITALPNIALDDSSTVEHFVYENGDAGSSVEFFKVTGGDHTWPGSFIDLGGTNYDMDAAAEIWRFFSQYDINGPISTTDVEDDMQLNISLYPNPTNGMIEVAYEGGKPMKYEVCSPFGQALQQGEIRATQQQIDLSALASGLYVIRIEGQAFKVVKQ